MRDQENQAKKSKTETSSNLLVKPATRLPDGLARASKAAPKSKKELSKKNISRSKSGEPGKSLGGLPVNPLQADGDWQGQDSRAVGEGMFGWMIHPVPPKEFYGSYSERQPLYLPRHPDSVTEARRLVAASAVAGGEGAATSFVSRRLDKA